MKWSVPCLFLLWSISQFTSCGEDNSNVSLKAHRCRATKLPFVSSRKENFRVSAYLLPDCFHSDVLYPLFQAESADRLMWSQAERICLMYSMHSLSLTCSMKSTRKWNGINRDEHLYVPVPIESVLEVVWIVEEVNFSRRSSNGRVRGEKFQQGSCSTLLHADDDRLGKMFSR